MTAPDFTPAEASRPVSPVLDAATIEHAVIDPEVVPALRGRFNKRLITSTADVALTHLIVATEDARPAATEAFRNFALTQADNPVVRSQASDALGTMTGSSLENLADTAVSGIVPKAPNRPFTLEESNVVDAALEIVASRDSAPRSGVDVSNLNRLGKRKVRKNPNVLLSGTGDDSDVYRVAARDLLARRQAERSDQNLSGSDAEVPTSRTHARRARVAQALHGVVNHFHIPHPSI